MKELTEAEKLSIQQITDDYAKNFTARRKASALDRAPELGEFSNDNSSWVQAMSAPTADIGDESFSFMTDAEFNFDEYSKAAKAETAIFQIKRLARSLTHPVKDSIRQYVLQRNSVIAANKAKAKEKEIETKSKRIEAFLVLN